MPFSLFYLLLHSKTTHLSGLFFLATEAKTVPNMKAINVLKWRKKLRHTQTLLVILLLGRVLKKRAVYDLKNS